MDGPPRKSANGTKIYDVLAPAEQRVPLVFSCPHSGRDYPPDFVARSRLDPVSLRKSEDCFIDKVFAAAPTLGAPMLVAHFPRAYVDVNREPFELDPAMFEDELPANVNSTSARVAAGLGTIAKVVAPGEFIYADKPRFAEAKSRAERCYKPYHSALRDLVDETRRRFGHCLLVDCHSMPSVAGPMEADGGTRRETDFVLGDCFGAAFAETVMKTAESTLGRFGYDVVRNAPYAGGFVTRHYGRPADGVHVLQVEVNRALYMDEERLEPTDNLLRLAKHVTKLMRGLTTARLALP